MVDVRKVAVSIRMPAPDVKKIKHLAERLGTRESEVIRFAVKTMLSRLAPLCEADAKGRSLVPAFVESGSELLRFFDLDTASLEAIINEGTDSSRYVDKDDIALIALTGAQQPYAALRLSQLSVDGPNGTKEVALTQTLREYLYEKYVYRSASGEARTQDRPTLSLAGGQL